MHAWPQVLRGVEVSISLSNDVKNIEKATNDVDLSYVVKLGRTGQAMI